MFDINKVSLCTTCMNRNNLLRQSLLSWLDKGFKKIYIVDWSSEEPVERTLSEFRGTGITIIRVDYQRVFQMTKARNLATIYTKTPILFLIDSDVRLTYTKKLIKNFNIDKFYHGTLLVTGASTTGSVLLSKNAFDLVNGYAENNPTLPGEDLEFYRRLRWEGFKERYFPYFSMRHIPHPYNLRYKYRPWNGLTRSQATKVTFKIPTWTKKSKRENIKHKVIIL